MNITVTKNQVSVNTDYILNDKEYNVNQCYFTFSDEYTDDLVKKAIFVQGTSTIEMSIINNQCQIPAEVLNNGQFELRVYAYEVDGDELLLRYSPSYTTAYVRTGSYIENAESPEVITPTQFEQYMQAMNDGLNEVANVDIDAEQLDNGMSVTITNRYGEDKTVYAYDGEKGDTGATPNIQIGTVVTGDHSEVTRTGTNENPIFNFVLEKGDKGDTGNGIASVTKTSTSGLTDTYTITYTNGTTTTFDITNGKSITNIAKTSTSGLEDTYTITYNDNTTSTFTVTNGNGISSIEKTGTQDNVDTYTIYYTNGTTSTFTVTNSTVTNQEFEELKAEHEELVNTLPRVEGTGTSITIDNTAQYNMNVALNGNTSQTTYTGKNLLNTQNWTGGYIDSSGNLHTGNTNALFDGYIEVNSNTQYVISTNTSIRNVAISEFDSSQIFIQRNQSSNNVSLLTITTTANTKYVRVQFNYDNSTTITQTIIDGLELQLESGSSRTSYEPYVGGIPSPNPNYPQPIKKITGNNSITAFGKNLFNITGRTQVTYPVGTPVISDFNNKIVKGINFNGYSRTSDATYTITETSINVTTNNNANYGVGLTFNLQPGSYYLSFNASTSSGRVALLNYNDNGVYQSNVQRSSSFSFSISTYTNIILLFYNNSSNKSCEYTNIQLETGSTATTYEPYQSQTYPINLGSLEYCKIGDYSDEFYLDNGNWYIRRNIGKVVLDGTETWSSRTNNVSVKEYYCTTTASDINSNDYISQMCNYGTYSRNTYNSGTVGKFAILTNNYRFYLCVPDEFTLDTFKTDIGVTNIVLYYVKATPTSEAITDTTLITQLNNLYNQIKSYKGQTNITQTNAELPFNIDASALYDLNNLISRVATLEVEV